jgi:uncharacterized protein YecT (DUF1311 family)
MKSLVALAMVCGVSASTAGALQECASGRGEPARVLACLHLAREAATEEMLEQFLGAQQAIATLGAQSTDASAALKQSQRAFERYVLEHCHGVQAMVAHGEAEGLACETDLLRQRASTLAALELVTDRL